MSADIYRTIVKTTVRVSRHDVWIGHGDYLIGARNHDEWPALFSERYKDRIDRPNRHYWHVGSWCLHLDTDWQRRAA